MAGTRIGVLKVAAGRVGLSLEEYQANVNAGLKWCSHCKEWHSVGDFSLDASRGDGLSSICDSGRSKRRLETYVPHPYTPTPGRRFVPARSGDKEQARGRVNHLIRVGLLDKPKDTPCSKCGSKKTRREYHHHKGYDAKYHDDVVLLCTKCHRIADKASATRKE